MKFSISLLVTALVFPVLIFAQRPDSTSLRMEWNLVQNNSNDNPHFTAALTFRNMSASAIPPTGWTLYFNLRYHGNKLTSLNSAFEIKNIEGDLFTIEPTNNFSGIAPDQFVEMKFTGNGRIANFQDVPSGFFLVMGDDKTQAIPLARPFVRDRDKLAQFDAYAAFEKNKLATDVPLSQLPKILPTPRQYKETGGSFSLTSAMTLKADPLFQQEANYLKETLRQLFGKNVPASPNKKTVQLTKDSLPPGAYQLFVTTNGIEIKAGDATGIFYGIQSLKSLLPPTAWTGKSSAYTIPCVSVEDAPRFPVRAFMLDVARNFQSKEQIMKILDVMALYKLNVFHFHFSDDEGWRLEIPGIPELTTIGAMRGYPFNDNSRLQPSYGSGPVSGKLFGSGYYSTSDFIEILKYATKLHIQVIPEIESPGHARAAVKAMDARYNSYLKSGNKETAEHYLLHDPNDQSAYQSNQYFHDNVMDVGLPSTYRFIEKVVDELQAMYRTAGAPLTTIHMAGDEVAHGAWEKSPSVAAYQKQNPTLKTQTDLWRNYFGRMKAILKSRGLTMSGWEELAVGQQTGDESRTVIENEDFIKDGITLDAWWSIFGHEAMPYKIANAGYNVVLTNVDYFYFDMAYVKSFDEPGDAWVGYIDLIKTFSFIPYNYYKNDSIDIAGNRYAQYYFKNQQALTEKGKANIRGIQGALWGENLSSANLAEYLILPRLLILAERAWAKEPLWAAEPDPQKARQHFLQEWSVFSNVLMKRELPKLNSYHEGYHYYIPAPGIRYDHQQINVNAFPGLEIRYTRDGSEPTITSPLYQGPIKFDSANPIIIKAFIDKDHASKSIITKVNK